MTRMNAGLILAGSQPNLVNRYAQGMRVGQARREMQQQNALADLYQQHGAGLVAGDSGAINALAALNPQAAMGYQQAHAENRRAEGRYQMAIQAGQRAAAQAAQQMSAADAKAANERIKSGLAAAMTAETPEQWDAIVQQFGAPELVGQFGNRDEHIGYYTGIADTLDRMAPPKPDYVQMNGQLVDRNAQGGPAVVDVQGMPAPVDSKEAEIARTMQDQGVDRATAQGIADGILKVSRDPLDGSVIVTNLATGQSYAPKVNTPSQAEQAAPNPAPEEVRNDQDAFGVEGFAKGAANRVLDTVGLDQPFPEVQQAQSDFAVLREQLMSDISMGYQRQPPSWLLKEIRKLTPQAGSIAEGPQGALSKLSALQSQLTGELRSAQNQLNRKMSPKGREALDAKLDALSAALDRIAAAKARLGGGTATIRPDVAERLKAYQ